MPLGQEVLIAQVREISRLYVKYRVKKIESGDAWVALFFSPARALFFSWDPDYYGVALAGAREVSSLRAAAGSKPPLAAAIKSHLAGASLIDVAQLCRDRIISLEFSRTIGAGAAKRRLLIFEASGRYSNLILVGDDGKIIENAKHIYPDTNRYRSVLPGLPYTPPPTFVGIEAGGINPDDPRAPLDLERVVGTGKPLLRFLQKICLEEPDRRQEILAALASLENNRQDARFFMIGGYLSTFPLQLPGTKTLDTASALEASREAVVLPLLERFILRHKDRLRRLLEKRLAITEKRVEKAREAASHDDEASADLLYGKLVLENVAAIPAGASEATLTEWTDSGPVEHKVALDPAKDAPANAGRFFARYKKQKARAAHARESLAVLEAERDELAEQIVLLAAQDDPSIIAMMAEEIAGDRAGAKQGSRRRVKAAPPPHIRRELPGATLFAGLSAKGNHYVTFRVAQSGDMWFHARNTPGAHVILRFSGAAGEDERRAFELAAACAAYYSKARGSGKVHVDFTEKRHVRAISGAGLAQVTYKDFGTITTSAADWESFLNEEPDPGV